MDSFLKLVSKAGEKWARKNVRDGFPHFNNWQYCYLTAQRYWPALAADMAKARDAIKEGARSPEAGRALIEAWRAVCRELRRERVAS